jgi:hypothetical protein
MSAGAKAARLRCVPARHRHCQFVANAGFDGAIGWTQRQGRGLQGPQRAHSRPGVRARHGVNVAVLDEQLRAPWLPKSMGSFPGEDHLRCDDVPIGSTARNA